MQKIHVILLLTFCTLSIYAQEVKIGIVPKDSIHKMEISEDFKMELPKLKWDEQVKNDPLKPLKFEGFNKRNTLSVDDIIYYSLYGNLNISPGLYTTQTAGGEISAQINRSFLVNFGAYGLKYDYNFSGQPYYDAVLHADASYKVLPWLILGAYGQYSAYSKYNARHGSMLPSLMVPYSGYGVNATTMFTETFGIQGTVGQEFNPINGKWQPVYGISPVINLNKFFK